MMVDSPISRARLHDLAVVGRSGFAAPGRAGTREASASPRHSLTDASSIAEEMPRHPTAPSSRPAAYDLVKSTI